MGTGRAWIGALGCMPLVRDEMGLLRRGNGFMLMRS